MSFLLIVISSFSQETYPKKIELGGDTLICLTPEQAWDINFEFEINRQLEQNLDSLSELSNYYGLLVDRVIARNFSLEQDMKLLNSNYRSLEYNNGILGKQNNINLEIIENYKKELKSQRKKAFKLTIGGFCVGVTTGSILFLVLSGD